MRGVVGDGDVVGVEIRGRMRGQVVNSRSRCAGWRRGGDARRLAWVEEVSAGAGAGAGAGVGGAVDVGEDE